MLSRHRQNMSRHLWHGMLPRFLERLLENDKLVCSATARTKTALGILQFCFNHFAASFGKVLDIHFSREVKERNTGSWCILTCSVSRV